MDSLSVVIGSFFSLFSNGSPSRLGLFIQWAFYCWASQPMNGPKDQVKVNNSKALHSLANFFFALHKFPSQLNMICPSVTGHVDLATGTNTKLPSQPTDVPRQHSPATFIPPSALYDSLSCRSDSLSSRRLVKESTSLFSPSADSLQRHLIVW